MTYSDKLARLTYYTLVLAIAAVCLWLAVRALRPTVIDARTGTPGLAVETDAGTGCQYVVTPWGGIFPRLNGEGKPSCKAPGQ